MDNNECEWELWQKSAPNFPEEICKTYWSESKPHRNCPRYRCAECKYVTGMTGYEECPNPMHFLIAYARKVIQKERLSSSKAEH